MFSQVVNVWDAEAGHHSRDLFGADGAKLVKCTALYDLVTSHRYFLSLKMVGHCEEIRIHLTYSALQNYFLNYCPSPVLLCYRYMDFDAGFGGFDKWSTDTISRLGTSKDVAEFFRWKGCDNTFFPAYTIVVS